MPYRKTTLSKFIIEDQRRTGSPDPDLTSLLNDVQTACKLIAVAVSRGRVKGAAPLEQTARDIMVGTCEWGGQLAGMLSEEMDAPHAIPGQYPRGRLLLVFDPLDGADNVDVGLPVGTIFSILRCPDGVSEPQGADFLQPGTAQVAAGYAIYGPSAMMVLTVGDGTHGFTLDRDIGAFTLTHPSMAIAPQSRELAVNLSDERFWEAPVRRYVDECLDGENVTIRWIASTVADVHRLLIRGGVFMDPRGAERQGRLRLLHEANPMAMVVEQAGGAADTGRGRLLELAPADLHHSVPVILGARTEVDRLVAYHAAFDRGEDAARTAPLFNVRSLFRTA